ncbi:peptidoglycan-binding protein [Pedobacter sp. SYSU D00535]|uniref:peptidoglycan-binding protein n=1 Tax=Pedobacter sp. SYSU D00535 TaxID=2810308 RepID=UPI001A957B8E|nr:peptidoglycan-binding protein [Pedobacter sp. SYSU D00535]
MIVLRNRVQDKLVEYLQKKLVSLQYDLLVDGSFGPDTHAAVVDFQTKNKLDPDGIVGGDTWTKIYEMTEPARQVTVLSERHTNVMHLHPKVRTAVVKVFVQLQSENIPFRIFEAYRYPQRQAQLYAQGRTKPGNIVTYARPWSSYHQYGLAVDFVLFLNGNWSWDTGATTRGWWNRLHQLGIQEGLMRLDFEVPHLQLAGTSSSALKQGMYPPGADKSWTDNMKMAIG